MVKGEDLREVFREEMDKGCHKWIGALTFQVRKGAVGKGTAVLISRNLILTAAHNLFDRR